MPFKHPLIPSFLDRSWWDSWDYPSILWDQHFGTVLSNGELYPPMLRQGFIVRPRTRAAIRSSGKSEVLNDKDQFLVKLSVGDFKVNELKVKICDNHVVIDGKHEERVDEHGSIQRIFSRRYVLPTDTDSKAVKCTLCPNGILVIKAPKMVVDIPPPDERLVPITLMEAAEDKK